MFDRGAGGLLWWPAFIITRTHEEARMSQHPRRLRLGLLLEGAGRTWTDWRHHGAHPGASTDLKPVNRYAAQRAERDSPGFDA